MSNEFPFSTQILELKVREAVAAYWVSRLDQKNRQRKGEPEISGHEARSPEEVISMSSVIVHVR